MPSVRMAVKWIAVLLEHPGLLHRYARNESISTVCIALGLTFAVVYLIGEIRGVTSLKKQNYLKDILINHMEHEKVVY
ncbi:MAG: hypothetical protein CSYNP_01601 [Syntrophus sp. SKADARSKE-3]|nr:hypothetical protein [Syntrophus sp. SKADARSKE-3]